MNELTGADFKSATEMKDDNKKLFIETYGCQMNVADSEVIASVMQMAGYSVAETPCAAASRPSWCPISPVTRTFAPFETAGAMALFPDPGETASLFTGCFISPNTLTDPSFNLFFT